MKTTIEMRFDPWPRPGERVLCALSGGLDSVCLLHLLKERCGGALCAAHFHHGLRASADRDEAFVRELCARWGIPLTVGRGDVGARARETGESPEEAGRALRYDFLERTARETGCSTIYTAHHADDNAETVLWNLIRGTGLQGLTGIPRRRGRICRPLLDVTRAELVEYAAAHDIPHVEDETNSDPAAASRNYLRLEVLPRLRELNPRAVEHIGETAAILQRENRALERLAEEGATSLVRREAGGYVLDLAGLKAHPQAVAERIVLRLMGQAAGHRQDFTARHVAAVLALAPGGCLSLPHDVTAERRGGRLVLAKALPPPAASSLAVGETVDFGPWRVALRAEPASPYGLILPEHTPVRVTSWRREDRMTLSGGRGPRSLKRLCQEHAIPPRERDTLPVLRVGDAPAAVPGIGVDAAFAPPPGGGAGCVFADFQKEM